jgi:molybdenum cofactor guanylyltransferase
VNISAVLLAGGESRRMGQDKTTLVFRGKPLWQTQVDLLRKLEPQEIFVSARTDPPWRPVDVPFVADATPSRGPLSGITSALKRINTDHVLVLAVDIPAMTENYLCSLCKLIGPGRGVVPMIGDRAEPLAAIYPKFAETDFTMALSSADVSLQSLIKKLVALNKLCLVRVSKEDEHLFRNLNKPGDFV